MGPLAFRDLDQVCDQTEAVWEEARGCDIFLTGGTGFFGCWLVESFLPANPRFGLGARLTVLTRIGEGFAEVSASGGRCRVAAADGRCARTLSFRRASFAFVIHAATEASVNAAIEEEPMELLSTILDGTRAGAGFCRGARGAEVSADQFGGGVWEAAGGDEPRAGELCREAGCAGRGECVRRRESDVRAV